jgi:hypothetical protein
MEHSRLLRSSVTRMSIQLLQWRRAPIDIRGERMSKRAELRAQYIEAWETMDAEKLVSAVAEGFEFDDPADPEPITKSKLARYMPIWPEKAKALGGEFRFEIADKVVRDQDGVLLEWYWWRLVGTAVEGAAVIKTTDEGVVSERLSYYNTPWPLRG